MARPERNNIDYFPHEVSHGKKMFYLRDRFGNDGYAVWFMLLEQLGRANYHYLDLKDDVQIMYLSSEFKISEDVLIEMINILVKFGEFDSDLWTQKIIYCQKFVDSIQDAYKRRGNKCITKEGIREHLSGLCSTLTIKTGQKTDSNPQRIGKDSKGEEKKEDNTISLMSELSSSDDLSEYENIALSFWELTKSTMEELNINSTDLSKSKIKNWVDPVRLAIEKDSRTTDEFREIFKFLQKEIPQKNGFSWKSNIRSGSSLRVKFEKLLVASRSGNLHDKGMESLKDEIKSTLQA